MTLKRLNALNRMSSWRSGDGGGVVTSSCVTTAAGCASAQFQGLTLVHSSAQLKRLLCDRGCT